MLNQFSDMRVRKHTQCFAMKSSHISRMLLLNSIALSVFIRKHKILFTYSSFACIVLISSLLILFDLSHRVLLIYFC